MKGKYQYNLLNRHSNALTIDTRKKLKKEMKTAKEAFRLIDSLWSPINDLPRGHLRNVKLALVARFTNHIFAQTILTERGLILDALNCARSATETTAFYWLVCVAPETAQQYDASESPRPVEIRKGLERRGIDISELRDRYQHESTAAHVGNPTDNWQIDWQNDKDGLLMVGGGPNLALQSILLEQVFFSAVTFFKHDPLYEISEQAETD